MKVYIAVEAESKRVAKKFLTDQSLSLKMNASTDPEKIRELVETRNADPKLQSWTMFEVEVIDDSIKQMIGQ